MLPTLLPVAAGWQHPGSRSFVDLFQATGFVGPLLVLSGLCGLALTIRRWLELRPERLAPATLQKSLELAVRAGQLDQGLAQATASRTFLGDLTAAGLHLSGVGLDEMLANVERAAAKETLRYGDRIANVARLGGVILLIGILGSVLGLISTMQVILVLKSPKVNDFVGGIGESLTCTAFALAVALCCFCASFWLDSRLVQRAHAVREIAEELAREAAARGGAGARS